MSSVDIVAAEARRMVKEAARPVPAGETVKGQIRRACRALGYRDGDWRVWAAWYGRAGSWSAVAYEDLRQRHARWLEKSRVKTRETTSTLAEAVAMLERHAINANTDAGMAHSDLRALVDAVHALRDSLGRLGL